MQEKNRLDNRSLGHGNFDASNDACLPESEEEYFDALQYPEELYKTTYSEQDLFPARPAVVLQNNPEITN